jgi:hypothetical protein
MARHGRSEGPPARRGKDDALTPNLTVGYVAERINRERLESLAARGSLADEAAATRSRATWPTQLSGMLGTALVRLGELIQLTARPADTPADSAALSTR